jgi:PAS domain S-box-containing protein
MFWNFFQWHSLKTRVTLFTLAIFVISIWSLAFYANRMLRGDVQRLLGEQQFSTATYIAEGIDKELQQRIAALELIASEIDATMLGNPTALQALLQHRPDIKILFNVGVFVTRRDGIAIADFPAIAGRVGTNYSDREHVAAVIKEGKSRISKPIAGRVVSGAPSLPISVPIRDKQGKVIGVLVGPTDLSRPNFLERVTEGKYGKTGGYILVATQHRLVIIASDKSRTMQALPAPGVVPQTDRFVAGFEGSAVYTNARGEEVLNSNKRIPAADWNLAVTMPTAEAFAPIRDMQLRMLLAAVFLTLLAGGLTWWMIRRQLSPMFAAVEKLADLSKSNQHPQPLPITSQDEIGELIGGFNRLLETLRHREKSMRESEERYHNLFDQANEGLMVMTREGKLLDANHVYAEMHGYTVDELKHLDIMELDVLKEKALEERADIVRRIEAGEIVRFEAEHYHKDGHVVPLSVTASNIQIEGQMCYLAFHQDITERRQAAKLLEEKVAQLAQSESRLARAMDATSDGLWEWDIPSGQGYFSPGYYRLLGYTEGEFAAAAESWIDLVHPEDKEQALVANQDCIDNRVESFATEFRMRTKDGGWRWILGRGKAVTRDASGKALRMIGTHADVTERNHALSELRSSELKYRRLIESSPDIVYVFSSQRGGIFYSPRVEALLGYSPDYLYAHPFLWRDSIHTEDIPKVTRALHSSEGNNPFAVEYRIKDAQGQWHWLLDRSTEVVASTGETLIEGLVTDITESKRSERVLLKSRYRLARAETIAHVGHWSYEVVDQAIEWSDGLWDIFGRKPNSAELTYETFTSWIREDFRAFHDGKMSQMLALGTVETVQDFIYCLVRPDGEERWVEVFLDPEFDAGGKALRFFGVAVDITERKQAELQHTQLEAQLREAQKMEALGTMAGGIAHDFNNVLAMIVGNVELARQDVGPAHPALESLEEIGKASRRAQDLVQQILSFSRRQTLERRPTSLALVVVETARLLRAMIPAGVNLAVDCKADAPAVLADSTQVKQILLNLCTNALQAVQDQGRAGEIEVRLEAHTQGETHGNLRVGHYACLTVRDNGAGMDEATRSRIFEPFFTTKLKGKGTGLGLSVVHGIVKAHGAEIEVESTLGGGTAFRTYFPATEESVLADAAPAANAASVSGKGKRVLYVDDEEAIIFLMKRLLERQGFCVSGYTDPREAVEAVRANPNDFDLAVTDFNMPGMSGLAVASALREIRADLPVLLASGYITEDLRQKAPAAGVRELIYKPNTVDDLCEAVARYANAQTAGQASKPS